MTSVHIYQQPELSLPNTNDYINNQQQQQQQQQNETRITTLSETKRHDELLGYVLMLFAAIAYTIHNIIIHSVSLSIKTSLIIRSFIQVLLSCLVLLFLIKPNVNGLTLRHVILLFLRGLFGGTALILLYFSFQKLPIGDATTIFFCTPVFTLCLSHIFLNEHISKRDFFATILSFTGILLMSSSSSTTTSFSKWGILYALISALLTAAAYTIVRALGNCIHFMVSVLSMGFSASLLTMIFLPSINSQLENNNNDLINQNDIFMVVIAALVGFIAQACTNRSLQLCRAGRGTLVRNIEVPLTYLVGIIALKEHPTPITAIGSTLVVTATIIIGMERIMKK